MLLSAIAWLLTFINHSCLSWLCKVLSTQLIFLTIEHWTLFYFGISSIQFSCSDISDSLRPHESQHTRPPCLSPTPGVHPNHAHWFGDATQTSHPLSSPSPPSFNLSQHQGLFKWVSFSQQVAKVLEFQLQHQSFQRIFRTVFHWDWLVGSPCSPRDSQESSPTPQFKSINSLVLSFLYSPTLPSVGDCWKNHRFD